MELRIYLRLLQRGWWIIALTTLSAVNISLIASYMDTPMYRARARFLVSPSPTIVSGRDVVTSLEALDKRSIVSTYAEFLNSRRIYNEVARELVFDGVDLGAYEISTVVLPDANILELIVEGPNPEAAALLANVIGAHAIQAISDIYLVYEISFLDPAIMPDEPYSPNPLQDAALALGLGLVAGAGLAILSEQIRIPLDAYRQRRSLDLASTAFTRRTIERRLEQELSSNPDGVLSLGLVELDGLHDLIDTLPQPVMQHVLRHVTNTLRKELRGNDLVGRWNELEFAVVMPATPGNGAARTLTRTLQALAQPVRIEQTGEMLPLKPYAGVVTYNGNETLSGLLARADKALQQSHLSDANRAYLEDMDIR